MSDSPDRPEVGASGSADLTLEQQVLMGWARDAVVLAASTAAIVEQGHAERRIYDQAHAVAAAAIDAAEAAGVPTVVLDAMVLAAVGPEGRRHTGD